MAKYSAFNFLILLSILGITSGCASQPDNAPTRSADAVDSTSAESPLITIAFTANRHGIMEPCGCSLKPLGGLPREWNLIQTVKQKRPNLIQVSAGVTFPSLNKEITKSELVFIRDRAIFLVDALNLMGVAAISPAAEDFKLGKATLLELAERSKFAWVSSNLYSKDKNRPWFLPFTKISKNGIDIFFLGLTSKRNLPVGEDVEVRKPDEVLPELLAKIPHNALIVLLTSLEERERLAIAKKYDRIQFILGGEDTEPETGGVLLQQNSAYYNSDKQARKVGVIDIGGKLPIQRFFSPTQAAITKEARHFWAKELKRKNLAAANRKKFQNFMKESEKIALEYQGSMTWITAETVDLDDEFDKPEGGPMTPIIENYLNQAHQRAIQSTEEDE